MWLIMTTQTHSVLHPSADSPSLLLGYFHDRAEHCSLCVLQFFPWADWLLSIGPDGLFAMCNYTSPTLASNLASCRRRHTRRCPVIGSAHVKLPKLGCSCLLECRVTFGDDGHAGFHLFDERAATRSFRHNVHERQHFESPSAAR